jgi:hypothetical protein
MCIENVKPHVVAAPSVSLMHCHRAESQYFTRGYTNQSTCILSIAPLPARGEWLAGNGFGKTRFAKSRFAVSLDGVPLARHHERLVGV